MLRELDKAWQVLPALDKAGVLSKHITPSMMMCCTNFLFEGVTGTSCLSQGASVARSWIQQTHSLQLARIIVRSVETTRTDKGAKQVSCAKESIPLSTYLPIIMSLEPLHPSIHPSIHPNVNPMCLYMIQHTLHTTKTSITGIPRPKTRAEQREAVLATSTGSTW